MRTFFVLFLLVVSASGAPESRVLLIEHVDVRSHQHTKFYADRKSFVESPDWTPSVAGPPLTVSAAAKIAVEAGKRRFADARDVLIDTIALQRKILYPSTQNPDEIVRWYYVVSVKPSAAPGQLTPIVILLDGKVIEAEPSG